MPVPWSVLRGGVRAQQRAALRRRGARRLLWICTACVLVAAAAASPAGALPAARARGLLKAARLVVAGEVAGVTSYDNDRISVVDFTADRVLKGQVPGTPPFHVALVELHEGPVRAGLTTGTRGIAFLRPASRTSYVAKTLPAGTYYELLPEFGAFISAPSAEKAAQQTELVARIVASASGREMDRKAARQLTFDLLAADNPLLVEDAGSGLVDLRGRPQLTPEELHALDTALRRTDMTDHLRVELIQAVAKGGIRDAAPALRSIETPPAVAEAAWRALDQLGEGAPKETLDARLISHDPDIRAATVRELLRRDGVDAVGKAGEVAIQDPDPAVRKAAVDALGALGKPEGLAPLERVFVDSPTDLQQGTARAILEIGGQPAIDACTRLAFTGPVDSQRYAVLMLMTMNDTRKQPALKRIAETHPDEQIRDLVTKGFQFHEH